jgi:hypothetical protein
MPYRNKYASPRSILATFMHLDTNMCRRNKLLCRSILDAEIGVVPSYQIRTRDNVHIHRQFPHLPMPTSSYGSPHLHPKHEKQHSRFSTEQYGQTTKHKNHKMRNDLICERCGCIETMEHVLCECLHYSQLIWI